MYKIKKKKAVEVKPQIKWTKRDSFLAGGITLLLFALFLFIKVIPEKSRETRIEGYSGIAEGSVVSYKSNKYNSQSFEGGQIKTISCTIDYKYEINKVVYFSSSTFPSSGKYSAFMKGLHKGMKVEIRFDKNNPKLSEIVIE